MQPRIKVMIADDHPLVRQGLKKILEIEPDIHVVGLAENGEIALRKAVDVKPDVMLLDINMPHMNGIQTLRRLKDIGLDVKVIMLTIHDDVEYVRETLSIGACGYVLKDAETDKLVKAIRNVNQGEHYIYPPLADELSKEPNVIDVRPGDEETERLTRREFEVITFIADGFNNKEIADKLFISEKTVKNHVSNIFKKIGVNDRTQAAIFAYRHNIRKL